MQQEHRFKALVLHPGVGETVTPADVSGVPTALPQLTGVVLFEHGSVCFLVARAGHGREQEAEPGRMRGHQLPGGEQPTSWAHRANGVSSRGQI